jgi:hypothetical protein
MTISIKDVEREGGIFEKDSKFILTFPKDGADVKDIIGLSTVTSFPTTIMTFTFWGDMGHV